MPSCSWKSITPSCRAAFPAGAPAPTAAACSTCSTSAPGEAERESCPKTGKPHRLFQRPDDNEATVAERLKVYEEKTRPLVDFYRAQGLLRAIDAEGPVTDVEQRLQAALQRR